MNKIQAKRLLNVAKALRESPNPKVFTMEQFYHSNHESCGTPACALGHYAARRDLQKSFKLDELDFYDTAPAVVKHFGLEENNWEYDSEFIELFDCNGCGNATTPKAAARYIERFVARKLKTQKAGR